MTRTHRSRVFASGSTSTPSPSSAVAVVPSAQFPVADAVTTADGWRVGRAAVTEDGAP